jgi:hypothetical protein
MLATPPYGTLHPRSEPVPAARVRGRVATAIKCWSVETGDHHHGHAPVEQLCDRSGVVAHHAPRIVLVDRIRRQLKGPAATRVDGRPHVFAVEEGLDWLVIDVAGLCDACQVAPAHGGDLVLDRLTDPARPQRVGGPSQRRAVAPIDPVQPPLLAGVDQAVRSGVTGGGADLDRGIDPARATSHRPTAATTSCRETRRTNAAGSDPALAVPHSDLSRFSPEPA